MLTTTTPLFDPDTLRIAVARDACQLDTLAEPWNALAGDTPFRMWEWMRTWWRYYRDDRSQLFTLLVTDADDELVGIAPWYINSSLRGGRVVRFLGSGEVCSDYLGLLCRPGLEQAVAERVADWLATEARDEWYLLDLGGIEADDIAIGHLAQRLADGGQQVDRRSDMSCWRVALPEDWGAYLAMLTKSRRERLRTLLRRTVDAGRAVVHQVKHEDELTTAFDIFVDLHQKRRQSLSQTGCFVSPRFEQFHRDIARQFLATGNLRLQWIELEGRPATAEYSFVGGQTVYYYQGGFDPQLAHESPGWFSLAASLRLAIDEGYGYYDFLRGDESYNTSWQAVARPLVRLRAVGNRPSARLRYAGWRACESTKSRVKQLLSRTKE